MKDTSPEIWAARVLILFVPSVLWNFGVIDLKGMVIAWAVLGVCYLGFRYYLRSGDDEILNKVQASQDRYEYEQEKKAAEEQKALKGERNGRS